MSDINGEGYGASHDWRYMNSNDSKRSFYVCRACAAFFVHHYAAIPPDIFAALERQGMSGLNPFPDKCPKVEHKGG